MGNEIWKPIKWTEGRYSVSSIGRVRNNGFYVNSRWGNKRFIPPKILIHSFSQGYPMVKIDAVSKTIHRLVAKEFIDNPENKPQINHKNGIRTDNRVDNLEWCTPSENIRHAVKTGLMKPTKEHIEKLVAGSVKKCSKPVINIKTKEIYPSVKYLSTLLGCNYYTILYRINKGISSNYKFLKQ